MMEKRRRGATAWAALAAIMLLASACGAPDPRTEIVFWGMGAEGEAVGELVPGFEAEHPGIRVRVQQIPWSAAHEKLLTAYVGGAVPDVAQLGNTWIPEFAALNAVEPLDARVASAASVDPADFFAGIWATNEVGGALYGLPWYVDTRVLFYRKSALARVGFAEPPATWADWRTAMERLADPEANRYGLLAPLNEWTLPVVLGLQADSDLLREGDRYGDFQGEAFREAFRFYVGLFRDGLVPPAAASQISNMYQSFAEGTFAMVVTGPWNMGEFRRRLPDLLQGDWTTAPLPGPDGPSVSTAGGASLVLFRGSEQPEAAWAFAQYLVRPDVQARFADLTGSLPARRSAWDGVVDAHPNAAAFADQLTRAMPTPKIPEWEQIANLVMRHAESAARGAATEDEALAALDRDVDRLLDKRRWLLARAESDGGGG